MSVLGTTKSRTASTQASFANEPAAAEESASQGVDDFAAMVWRFARSSGDMVEEMDTEVRRKTGYEEKQEMGGAGENMC